jgi:proteasome beta subunit
MDPFGGTSEESKFTATGSGSPVALGYIEESYKKGLSTKDGAKSAVKALSIAMRRDSATGDHMTVAVISKAGYTEYTDRELDKFVGSGK